METRGLNELGYKIFLDRYALKDTKCETLQVGDLVLVKLDDNTGQKEIGYVESIQNNCILVALADGSAIKAKVDIEHIDKPLELDPADMWKRVALAMAKVEKDSDTFDEWHDKFIYLLEDWKFIPGGRILAGAGTATELTYYNCYVLPSPHDSKAGIFKTLNDMAQIMARGGGVGLNLSSLRPRYAYAKATNGRSSGAVSWGEIYSYTTGLIEQGGCIVGGSLVATAKGNIPIKDLVGEQPWVYSFNNDDGQVVLKQASWVGKTGIRKEVYKLQTDKGLILYATPDHRILCRDGEYRQLADLKPGQRIMPLIRKLDKWGKDIVVQRRLGDRAHKSVYESDTPIHRFVYSEVSGVELTSDDHIHHKDENHLNNDPTNLELLSHSDHTRLHAIKMVEDGRFALTDYVNALTHEERQMRARMANDAKLAMRKNDPNYNKWLTSRLSSKFNTSNPMKTGYGVIHNNKARAINLAYKFINNGIPITTPEEWDAAIRSNLKVRTKCYGLGITTNNDPKSTKLIHWYGSYKNFMDLLSETNHRVEIVELSHYEDVYDMEVPQTNNFAVVIPGDQTTGGIFIHNSRRGALMLILDDWHPDILEFINAKRDMKRILNANISVGFSDAFMNALEADEDWQLMFPDTSHPDYDEKWNGDLLKWVANGLPIKVWKTIKARELWNAVVESAWACAEPGIWFKGRSNSASNSHYYAPLIATNPCAEQPLPAWSVCLLGSINLTKFVNEFGGFEWAALKGITRYAVRFMDNVIDATPYIYPEMEKQQKSERRIGLGTMGLAEVLIRMKLQYGSEDSLNFINDLYQYIAVEAYTASIELAKERGAFPNYNIALLDGEFMKNMPDRIPEAARQHGIRNVTLLTQAPTGTIGTMANTSTGIEPFYFWEYERKGRLGSHIERVKVYDEWASNVKLGTKLPDYFVTAQDLTPEEHVKVQATIQRWVDSSISKTCNVPSDYTVEQVGELYRLMYDLGCKGGTIYRDGSRNEQILNLLDNTESKGKTHSDSEEQSPQQSEVNSKWRSRPAALDGKSYRKSTPVGTAYIVVNHNGTGEPFETFINVGRAGSDVQADAEGLGRLISLILRMPSPLSIQERIENIAAQLGGIGSGRAQGFGKHRVMSLPDAVAQVLVEHLNLKDNLPGLPEYSSVEEVVHDTLYFNGNGDICPGCGNASLMRVEGCQKCHGCGYSLC